MQALADRAERVRDRVPLSSIVGRDVKLEKAGRELTGLCPFHSDRKVGSFMVNDDKQMYHCFSCSAHGDVIKFVMERKGKTFMEALRLLEADAGIDFADARDREKYDRIRERRRQEAAQDSERRKRNARHLWVYSSVPGIGTPAQAYLEGRGIDFSKLGHWPGALRFKSDLFNTEVGRPLPGMVGAIHDSNGHIIAVHRTWLKRGSRGWTKADLKKPKMVLGDFYGGSIPLWKGVDKVPLSRAPAGSAIALSEGIEDGLSVAIAAPELRVHAGVSIDNIGNVVLPPRLGAVTFLCQRDRDAREAAAEAARACGDLEEAAHHEKAARQIETALERAIGKQQARAIEDRSARPVLAAWPEAGFKDWNDQLRGQQMGDGA